MIKRLLIQIYYSLIYYIPNALRELFLRVTREPFLVLNGFMDFRFGKFHHCNWGDDLNMVFLAHGLGRKIIHYQTSVWSRVTHKDNYMCIGSMLHDANADTIVWGSGFLSDSSQYKLPHKPKQILAVRGKLTRSFLLQQGIDCPDIYGDPALLLPLFYQPATTNKYKLGIIPHIYDEDNPFVREFRKSEDVKIISLRRYHNWHDIIDQICSCELILSSSLHGLIVSDAYHIPNCWVEFSDKVVGNGFKFRDYFSSVARTVAEPIRITTPIDIDNLSLYKEKWSPIQFDPQPLINACPFPSLRLKMLAP